MSCMQLSRGLRVFSFFSWWRSFIAVKLIRWNDRDTPCHNSPLLLPTYQSGCSFLKWSAEERNGPHLPTYSAACPLWLACAINGWIKTFSQIRCRNSSSSDIHPDAAAPDTQSSSSQSTRQQVWREIIVYQQRERKELKFPGKREWKTTQIDHDQRESRISSVIMLHTSFPVLPMGCMVNYYYLFMRRRGREEGGEPQIDNSENVIELIDSPWRSSTRNGVFGCGLDSWSFAFLTIHLNHVLKDHVTIP